MTVQIQSPQYIKKWASKIKQMGLTVPAVLLLETHKPLSFIVNQMLTVGQPALNLFLSPDTTANALNLFSNRVHLEQLIQELEDK